MKIYFDGQLLNQDYYTQLSQSYIMFNEDENFKLGSTLCHSLVFGVDKTKISSIPNEIMITINDINYGNYILDNVTDDGYEMVYTLIGKMINFEFNYDASGLISRSGKIENGQNYVYLKEILEDICNKANIELKTESFIGAEKHISWYDNSITAREYIGYIAELNGGYALINSDGDLELKQFNNNIVKTINISECENFKIGEYHKITRVVYDYGIDKYEAGNETGNTLYINESNVFITEQSDIDNIFEVIDGLEFYSFEVDNCPIYNDVVTGDCIAFFDGTNIYKTFAQYELEFFGNWLGGYKFRVSSNKQEETMVIYDSPSMKTIKTRLNRDEAKLEIIASQTENVDITLNGKYTYFLTNDSSYQEDKEYYWIVNDEYVLMIARTDYTLGNLIPSDTVYERTYDKGINSTIGELSDKVDTDHKEIMGEFAKYAPKSQMASIETTVKHVQKSTYTKTQIQQIANGTGYFFTNDTKYQVGTTYYKYINNEYVQLVNGTDYNVDDDIPENTIYEYGSVSAIVNNSGTFDKDGMHYRKDNAPTESTINQYGLEVDSTSDGSELLYAGYDNDQSSSTYGSSVVRTENLKVRKYINTPGGGRFESYTDENGNTGVGFFIGVGD